MEILSRLPSKSVALFRCVSKRWASMFASPSSKELFMTKSSAKSRLLFAIAENGTSEKEDCVWSFFSSPQLENPYEKSSSTLVAAAEFHVKFSPENLRINYYSELKYFSIGYASGLIYIYGNRYQARPVICNPNTGRYAILPNRYTYRKAYSFFGFDPIGKQYKALSIIYPTGPGRNKILTLGDGDFEWRKIKCPLPRPDIKSDGICINGVLYFLAESYQGSFEYVIVCFDVRSETFTYIGVEKFCRLINYKGKLAMIYWEDDVDIYAMCNIPKDLDEYLEENLDVDATNELRVWVLEDVEKQKWSKYAYTWTDDKFFRRHLSIAGATASGEIVFSMRKYTSKQPFYVFYFNPERNTLQRVEIQGFGEAFKKTCSVRTFVNHIEDLDVNDLKQLKSVHPPLKPEFYCLPEADTESDSDSDSESDGQGDEEG
ncbi:F-box-like domain superfamily [Arabidopsis thaliana x Arabidopsis arenosa]|uniref:F-box-like domain superfamily n=1 Tax=Arabidopsis thaliana x Arabidopsis arenosa TaxID=1240361 RepID=A0A8T1ZK44_9BRAS|nr:F-box-like domain superfamily [Arabidopsis thaliana x Arabidopsis arenosa]